MSGTRRTYHSPLRDRQARQTREHVLDTLIELVSTEGAAELSVRDLAKRAGVSERTVYRHFPDRAALLDALGDHVGERVGWRQSEENMISIDNVAERIEEDFTSFERFEAETRALVLLNLDPARVAGISRRNHQAVRAALERDLSELRDDEIDELAAVVHLLASSRTWLRFRDEFGLSAEQTVQAVQRAMRSVIADARRRASVRSG